MTTHELFENHVYLTSYHWEEHMRAKLFERTKDERHYVWPGMESRFVDFKSGMAAGMERAAEVAEPKNKRGCDCTSCDCGNVGDAETVAAWDRATEIAAAIRAMKGEVK